MDLATGKIHTGDCIKKMRCIDAGTVDLVFADPPFNIGYDYDTYDDSQSYDDYLIWSRKWMTEVSRILKPSGTFWLAIGDDYAAELKMLAQNDLGLTCRSWVIWYYTFGVNCTRKFSRSHTHLFHFVKDKKKFTFNADDPAVRVPSARQLVYADRRANSKGRLPDDTWILRPQDANSGFAPTDDTWYFARVAGTFKEREGFHGCQMPEQLLGRIIRASSNSGDVVFDPFAGSGTSLVVAKKLGRKWLGSELSKEYAQRAGARIRNANIGDDLDGPEDPLVSAPRTPKAPNRKSRRAGIVTAENACASRKTNGNVLCEDLGDTDSGIIDAYLKVRNGESSDYVLADPEQSDAFAAACGKYGLPGSRLDWNRSLLNLRKKGRLPRGECRRRRLSAHDLDSFGFASEIALQTLRNENNVSLDDILCDPKLASEFDKLAERHAPGFSPFEYRWAALGLRKRAYHALKQAQKISRRLRSIKFPRGKTIERLMFDGLEGKPGVYLLRTQSRDDLFIGETFDLATRLRNQLENLDAAPWCEWETATVNLISTEDSFGLAGQRRALQLTLIRRHDPLLNAECWKSAQLTAA